MTTAGGAPASEPFIPNEREIWTIAGLMIQEFGDRAVIEAALRADKALSKNDIDNQGLWRRVIKAITDLTETEGETIH
jgi:hypothetical protein